MAKQINLSDDEYGIPIHIIEKNSREQIRIGINEYRGIDYIDIRLFYLSEDKYLPSPKGITFKKDQYLELLKGVVLLGESLGYTDDILQKALDE